MESRKMVQVNLFAGQDSVLCDDLARWDVGWGGREAQEGGDIYIHIIDSLLYSEKLTLHCKAIIIQ